MQQCLSCRYYRCRSFFVIENKGHVCLIIITFDPLFLPATVLQRVLDCMKKPIILFFQQFATNQMPHCTSYSVWLPYNIDGIQVKKMAMLRICSMLGEAESATQYVCILFAFPPLSVSFLPRWCEIIRFASSSSSSFFFEFLLCLFYA